MARKPFPFAKPAKGKGKPPAMREGSPAEEKLDAQQAKKFPAGLFGKGKKGR